MAQNTTTSLDLPAVLSQLLGPMTPPVTQTQPMQQPEAMDNMYSPAAGLSTGMGQDQPSFLPSYAMGGAVGPGGMPMGGAPMGGAPMGGAPMGGMPPGGAGVQMGGAQQPVAPQQVQMQIDEFVRGNPEQVAQIQQVIQAGLQAGEITMEDINMMEQLAMTALQNPEMYPYVRNFAIQQGFAGEQDLSPEYDEGLIITVLTATRVAKEMGGMGGMGGMEEAPLDMEQVPNFAMGGMVDDKIVRPGDMAAEGGKVKGPGTGTSDSVPIRVSTGEYVIPANVVRMKGQEFFDSMLEKYRDGK